MRLLEQHIISLILEKNVEASLTLIDTIKKLPLPPNLIYKVLNNLKPYNNDDSELNLDIDYIDLSVDPGYITYIPSSKITNENPWTTNRQKLKIGRLLNRLGLTPKEVDLFSTAFKSSGIDIKNKELQITDNFEWYLKENSINRSTLAESCMNSHRQQPYLKLYNLIGVKLLILTETVGDKELCIGRALLWKTDQTDMFMDRIYYAYEWVKFKFIDWAIKNGYTYKKYQSYSVGTESHVPKMTYQTDVDINAYFPYLDTFIWYYKGDSWSGFSTKLIEPKSENDILLQCQNEEGEPYQDGVVKTWKGQLRWQSMTSQIGNLIFDNGSFVWTVDSLFVDSEIVDINKNLIYGENKMKFSEFCKKYLPYIIIEDDQIQLTTNIDLRKIEIDFEWDKRIDLNNNALYLNPQWTGLNIKLANLDGTLYIKGLTELGEEWDNLKSIAKECL